MSSARAVRYRKLALASGDQANADLLLKLADECDRGCSAPLNGFCRGGHPSKMGIRQKVMPGQCLSGIQVATASGDDAGVS
jgi:hypothetical protein